MLLNRHKKVFFVCAALLLTRKSGSNMMILSQIICQSQSTSQIDFKVKYPCCKGNAAYFVGSEGSGLLSASEKCSKIRWTSLPKAFIAFEPRNIEKKNGRNGK